MSLTESTMLALASTAPRFSLKSTSGKQVAIEDFDKAEVLVVLFICNHCPYVIHIAPALKALSDEYLKKGVAFVAINSNDTKASPADGFEYMVKEAEQRGYAFPYLLDEDQSVAKAYGAACTPDIYVFDKERRLAYRGQFDDTRPNRISSGNYDSSDSPASGEKLAEALDTLLRGDKVPEQQIPSMGCNIKWIPGNEPDYYG